ncbi:unnamed protein product [Leptidea sinapis]|uniref:Uncharacterized protein n=1 Tax=Leptidea sinapis TaxID=189913 RepID=A0A5E4QU72_9NEOP|nr:unnamed protein product [Leptidea sinapis]
MTSGYHLIIILEVRSDWIPTGRLLPVAGSAFDLRTPRRLGDIIEDSDILFHHNFCVSRSGFEFHFAGNTSGNRPLSRRIQRPAESAVLQRKLLP